MVDGTGPARDDVRTSAPVAAPANPYVFVVGAARSGTTLLQRMLDAHPLLAVVNETYWLPRKFRERTGLTRRGVVTPALIPLLLDRPRFARMGVTEADLLALLSDEPVRYERFVSSIFDLYAARAGKPLAGDKTPGYVRRMGQIHELWPTARFIHIIRDPRDVSLSMLDWASGERTAGQYGTWQLDPVVSTALYWRCSVGLGRESGDALGWARYCEVRYEDLVAAPREQMERLCAFLDLPFDDATVRFHEGKSRPKPGRSSKAQWLPPTVGLRDWDTQLPRNDAALIEAAVGCDLLDILDYPRRLEHITPAMRAHVDNVRDTFTRNALARERVLPRSW